MDTSSTTFAVATAVIIPAAVLLLVAWIPWSIAAALYRSLLVPGKLKRLLGQFAVFLSFLAFLVLVVDPAHLYIIPPVADFIDYVVSDEALAHLTADQRHVLRSLIIAECIMALLLPVVLILCFLAAVFIDVVVKPPLRFLVLVVSIISDRLYGLIHSFNDRIAQRQRQVATARLQQQEHEIRVAEEFQQQQERRLERQRQIADLVRVLEDLHLAQDFRRAALVAKQATELSDSDRRELFQLYRTHITNHFARCLDRGGEEPDLLGSLRELLEQLNVAGTQHESLYILADAKKQLPSINEQFERDYRGKLAEIREQHRIRIRAVREELDLDDPDFDPEFAERIIEAQHEITKAAVFELTVDDDPDPLPLDVPFSPVEDPSSPDDVDGDGA